MDFNFSGENLSKKSHCIWNIVSKTTEESLLLQCQIGFICSPCFQDIGLKIRETFKKPPSAYLETCFVKIILKLSEPRTGIQMEPSCYIIR